MSRIAIVIQRYGEQVSGGGEFYARALAKHLNESNEVTVLTTTSLDLTFEKYFQPGEELDDGVRVIRFDNDKPRDFSRMQVLSDDETNTINSGEQTRVGVDLQWVDEWGPYCPRLIRYIENNRDNYDGFIVFTYIYYTSVRTIPVVKDKVIFIPTAHDEIWARPSMFRDIFSMPRFIGFLTAGEEKFVREFYKNDNVEAQIIGCGVDKSENVNISAFKDKFNISGDYIAYVGRIDISKGCDELVKYFIKYKKVHPSNIKLVLVGGGTINCPKRDDIIFTGFVTEEEKFSCIEGSMLTVAPSAYESLCIAVLESFACHKPIMANAKCEILDAHCDCGRNGFSYKNEDDFVEKLHTLLTCDDTRTQMGNAGYAYLKENYTWDIVTAKINQMVQTIIKESESGKTANNDNSSEYLIRDVFADGQLNSDVIFANKKTIIEPYFGEDSDVCVCFASSDYFAPMCGVAVNSIIENSNSDRKYDILILTNKMSVRNKIIISNMSTENCKVRFVEFEDNLFSEKVANHDSYNVFTYYRLMIPSICSRYEKVLYLDSDMIINHDVAELFDEDITDYYAAAVLDLTILTWQVMKDRHPLYAYLEELDLTEVGTYMQGGVALYNVAKIDKDYPVEVLVEKANERQYQNCDQELLNMCFRNKIKFMPVKWNTVVMHPAYIDLYEYWMPKKYYDMYIEARKNPYIIHYSFGQMPCYGNGMDMFEYFWKYARNTVYYEELLTMLNQKCIQNSMAASANSGVPTDIAGVKHVLTRNERIKCSKVVCWLFPYNSKRRNFIRDVYRKIRY